ncbi:uncharacterized protein GGS25DRAFT_521267 [Hypoxylon fragiforme]|uniref:uncharacterized protein n=1 Tax=Hypoxylon fragiforme TaxID=63214 RepID=UPI0020C72DF2|nr:uncharacterized protein GGS25DRAFT_521267 [Hypoxylon fragiforme]KAI2608100.1 hypothetical protein GGS25DRAFT_521267 [Hypoxylon fragiforme]
MKRSMAGHTEGPSAKMARTAHHPMNYPQVNANTSLASNNTGEVDELKARNEELLKINKELLDMLKVSMKKAKDDLAAERVELKSNREFGAKIQGEISAMKRPRRQTTLRKEVEESQTEIHGLREELENTKAENTQLRDDMAGLQRDRDFWKSLFEQNQKMESDIQGFNMPDQHTGHPTPPPFITGAGGFNPPQTCGNMELIQTVMYQAQAANSATVSSSQQISLSPIMYQQPQQATVAAGSSLQQISAAPVYRSPDSTGNGVALPQANPSPDNLRNMPEQSLELSPWEPNFNLNANDLNIDIDAFLADVFKQGAPGN